MKLSIEGVLAAISAGLISLGLLVAFVVALPAAVEKERTGRENAVRAVCDPVLQSERAAPALGDLPVAAPEFALSDWNGKKVSLASQRGRVVLVNFWATWCPTCVVEMPSLEALVDSQKGKPFTMLAVSVDQKWDEVKDFFRQGVWAFSGTRMTVLLDEERSVPKRYGTEKFPETFIVDKEGRVRFYVISDRNWGTAEMRNCIDALERE